MQDTVNKNHLTVNCIWAIILILVSVKLCEVSNFNTHRHRLTRIGTHVHVCMSLYMGSGECMNASESNLGFNILPKNT